MLVGFVPAALECASIALAIRQKAVALFTLGQNVDLECLVDSHTLSIKMSELQRESGFRRRPFRRAIECGRGAFADTPGGKIAPEEAQKQEPCDRASQRFLEANCAAASTFSALPVSSDAGKA
jgi:hypothetical protein